jgi:hypothetical protein
MSIGKLQQSEKPEGQQSNNVAKKLLKFLSIINEQSKLCTKYDQ